MAYLWETEELICYDTINPIQYVFHKDTETCTPVYTLYNEGLRVRMNHAIADGFLVANVFRLLKKEIDGFVKGE